MEPANLTPPNEDRLDALLRDASAPLADAGFSSRVLAALPARTPAAQRRRFLLCLAGLAAGVAVALPNLDQWPDLATLSIQLTSAFTKYSFSPSEFIGWGMVVAALLLTLRSGKNQESRL